MATTEDIEARLAAYIDGELDSAERAEIEQHLASNPQHRRLIDELSRQRDDLRALPRARAPQDIVENINAHLERAALLGDETEPDEPILRISHWPQIKAAAAVLLLVFSLAAVVYYVVSSPPVNEEFARVVEEAPTVPDSAGSGVGGVRDDAFTGNGSVLTGDGTPDTVLRVPPSPQESRTRSALVDSLRGERLRASGDATSEVLPPAAVTEAPGSEGLPISGGPSGTHRQVLVQVTSPDPFVTQRNVEQFLISNNIEFQPTDQIPEPLRLQASNAVFGARLNQTRVRVKQEPPPAEGQGYLDPQLGTADNSDRNPMAPREQLDATDASETEDEQASAGAAVAQAKQESVYVARRLSRTEIEALRVNLSDQAAGQTAQVFEEAGEAVTLDKRHVRSAAPATQPDDPVALELTEPQARRELGRTEQAVDVPAAIAPATQPGFLPLPTIFGLSKLAARHADEERVDVLIVVRGVAADQAPPDGRPAQPQAQQRPLEEQPSPPPATAPADDPADDGDQAFRSDDTDE